MFAEIRRFWNAKLNELKRQMQRYKAAQTKESTQPREPKGRQP
jgi:hypothetical protein